jgi:hypothetical protein
VLSFFQLSRLFKLIWRQISAVRHCAIKSACRLRWQRRHQDRLCHDGFGPTSS